MKNYARRLMAGVLMVVLCLSLMPLGVVAGEGPERFTFEAGVWPVNLGGSLMSGGVTVNLCDDLGLKTTTPLYLGAKARVGTRNRVDVGWFNLDTSSTTRAGRAYTYSGTTFNLSDTVSASLRFSQLDATFRWNLLGAEKRDSRFDALLGMKYIDFRGELRNATSNASIPLSGSLFVPTIGLGGEAPLGGSWRGSASVKWIDGGWENGRGSVLDYGIGVSAGVGERLSVAAEYSGLRFFSHSKTGDESELTLTGPRVTLNYRF